MGGQGLSEGEEHTERTCVGEAEGCEKVSSPCVFFFFCVLCDGCVDYILSPVSGAYLDVRNTSFSDPYSLVLRDTQVGHICCLACWWNEQDGR